MTNGALTQTPRQTGGASGAEPLAKEIQRMGWGVGVKPSG